MVSILLLKKIYGTEKLELMTQNEFEELIVDYIKKNFTLFIDKDEVKLDKGGIKLGSHQTDLKFVLPAILPSLESLHISIPAFKENENHQTIFTHNLNGSDHKILKASNTYKATIILSKSTYGYSAMPIILVGLISLITISYLFRKRKELQLEKIEVPTPVIR